MIFWISSSDKFLKHINVAGDCSSSSSRSVLVPVIYDAMILSILSVKKNIKMIVLVSQDLCTLEEVVAC